MAINEFFLLNLVFLTTLLAVLTKNYTFVITLLGIEICWVALVTTFILAAPGFNEVSFFMYAIMILILSAVELVVGLLLFMVLHGLTGYKSAGPQSLRGGFYASHWGGTRKSSLSA